MNSLYLAVLVISILIALIASTLTGLIKIFLFKKRRDTFSYILKYAIWGEIIGFMIMLVVGRVYKTEINKWTEPDSLFAIPIGLTLLGLILGTVLSYKSKKAGDLI